MCLQSYWRLAPDEALLIEADRIPEAGHWNLQISNFWMESLDYRYHRIHVNKHTAHYEPDGSMCCLTKNDTTCSLQTYSMGAGGDPPAPAPRAAAADLRTAFVRSGLGG